MTKLAVSFWARIQRAWLSLIIGAVSMLAIVNLTASNGVTITDQEEAVGPQFSDPNTLDLFSKVRANSYCPILTQHYVWRNIGLYKGVPSIQIVPLANTVAPFIAPNGGVLVTLDAHLVPDKEMGGWQHRQTSIETCPWLPTIISNWFSPRLKRSPDKPVNFIGAEHDKDQH